MPEDTNEHEHRREADFERELHTLIAGNRKCLAVGYHLLRRLEAQLKSVPGAQRIQLPGMPPIELQETNQQVTLLFRVLDTQLNMLQALGLMLRCMVPQPEPDGPEPLPLDPHRQVS